MQDDGDNVQCPECDRSFTSTQGLNGHVSLRHVGRQKRCATSPAPTVVRQTRRRTGTVANDDESQFQMELHPENENVRFLYKIVQKWYSHKDCTIFVAVQSLYALLYKDFTSIVQGL
jgi:hypothetical protein